MKESCDADDAWGEDSEDDAGDKHGLLEPHPAWIYGSKKFHYCDFWDKDFPGFTDGEDECALKEEKSGSGDSNEQVEEVAGGAAKKI